MLIKTHLSITLFLILLFLSSVEQKVLFVVIAILATFLADIDSKYSKLGQKKIFRILQFFIRHRTIFHSFTFLFFLTAIFVTFVPVIALPFFLGYSSHLIADSFTVKGIRPFYPLRALAFGKLRTGSKTETAIFLTFVILDFFLLLLSFSNFS